MTLLAVVIAGFCAIWVVQAALVFKNLGELKDLARLNPALPTAWPRVSVIMPARNEATDIAASLESRLGDAYPDLEIVVVDDRSDDDTPRIVAEFASRDPRVRPVRIDELPHGWLGKVHALDIGVREATGTWLLFSDADIEMAPGILGKAVAHCEANGLDLLAMAPEFRSRSAVVDMLWAIFMRVLSMAVSPKAVRDPDSKVAMGSGGFTLVRRDTFDLTPGFEHLRLETGDDVALGLMVKQAGGRCDFVNGRRAAVVSIYDDLPAFFHGVEKNGSTFAGTPFVALAAVFALLGLPGVLASGCARRGADGRHLVARLARRGDHRSRHWCDHRGPASQHRARVAGAPVADRLGTDGRRRAQELLARPCPWRRHLARHLLPSRGAARSAAVSDRLAALLHPARTRSPPAGSPISR